MERHKNLYPDKGFIDSNRKLVAVKGSDSRTFLESLISNSISKSKKELTYAALLNPQGKYLFDFFIQTVSDQCFHIDVKSQFASKLMQRLMMYRLRSDVDIQFIEANVFLSQQGASRSFKDPRHLKLGWRTYTYADTPMLRSHGWTDEEYNFVRIENCIPESGLELLEEKTYILEAGFERLAGVDFKKGCFVGQEVTARMRHKSTLKKGLVVVTIEGQKVEIGTEIFCNGTTVGTIFSQAADKAIAHLKFKFAGKELSCGKSKLYFLKTFL